MGRSVAYAVTSNGHENPVRARLGYLRAPQLASIDLQHDEAPCALVSPSRFSRRRPRRPCVTGACASLTSSRGSLWRRRAAPPSRHRAGEARDGGQPAAEAEQSTRAAQAKCSLTGSCLGLLGQHDGPASGEEPAVRCFFGRTKSGSSFLQKIM